MNIVDCYSPLSPTTESNPHTGHLHQTASGITQRVYIATEMAKAIVARDGYRLSNEGRQEVVVEAYRFADLIMARSHSTVSQDNT